VLIEDVEELLETYEFEEVLYQSEVTLSEALLFLINEGVVEMPKVRPVSKWEDTPPTEENEELFDL
jgi:hypothetical protein